MISIELTRVNGDFGFEATDSNGHTIRTDTSIETGGNNFGVRPMQLLLMGLGSCSAIDIVLILKKQRQPISDFRIRIEAERERGKEPALWKNIRIHFLLKGAIDEQKARKACELSITKYCSVAETLRLAGSTIAWELHITND